ncbi:pyridoxamine 5'-phosphate oxidase family protein [Halovulum sp. GXIMD14794]
MARAFARIAFTPEVLAEQRSDGSAAAYARLLAPDVPAADVLSPVEAAFISARDGFYQASVSSSGWPYVQFRGGYPGFLKVLDARTLAYADLRGNRQHLSAGNLSKDGRIALFFMDYAERRRLKVWGEATLLRSDQDPGLAAQLTADVPRTKVQRLVRIRVRAFDWNCPQHIPQRFTLEEVEAGVAHLQARLAELEEQNDCLRSALEACDGDHTSRPPTRKSQKDA